jgi:three-Cys-motif partner protein
MGKTKRNNNDEFGGRWTVVKLAIIEQYLDFFTTVLKGQKVRRIYIDAFAGSGKVVIKGGKEIDGSASIALKYDFDEYYFIDIKKEKIDSLQLSIEASHPEKKMKISYHCADCNDVLIWLLNNRIKPYTRSVIFLDPFTFEVSRSVLEKISKNPCVDLWYLFHMNRFIRCMSKEGKPSKANCETITKVLGTDDWISACYRKNNQLSIFEDLELPDQRIPYKELQKYIENNMGSLFPNVHHFKLLRNEEKNAPLFLLCFFMTNPRVSAISLGTRGFEAVMKSIDKRINSGTLFIDEK